MAVLNKAYRKIREYVPRASLVIFIIGAAALIINIAFIVSSSFADFFNENISSVFRFIFAKITSVYPASLAEYILFSVPVLIALILPCVFRYMDRHEHGYAKSIFALISVAVLMYSVFVFDFGAGYKGTALEYKLGLDVKDSDAEELYDTTMLITKELNSLADDVSFANDGASVRPYDHNETVSLAYNSYEKLSSEYNFIKNFKAPVKRLAISKLMTYTHISGVYSFYTGEANLNTNYPEFVNVYTIAHEMAHQRGIARENEANFIAYLVCIGSDDAYMRYSGYLNMFQYMTTALSGESSDYCSKVYSSLDARVKRDLVKYSEFFDKYRESKASEVSETVNNTYLVLQGTEGTKSYGMVVDLALAYYRD